MLTIWSGEWDTSSDMKRIINSIMLGTMLALAPVVLTPSCATSQERVTYNTLYSLEKTATAAYDTYLELLIEDKVDKSKAREVSRVYNQFQVGMQAAVDVARYDWNSVAPDSLAVLLNQLLDAINQAKGL